MVGELGRKDVGQQPRAAQPLGDRADLLRPGRPQALLYRHARRVTVLAGVALLDGAADEEPRRLQVELLGGLLADADARPAATGTALLRLGQVVDDLAALQVFGQRCPAVRGGLPRPVGLGDRGDGLTFRAAAEAVLQGRVELGGQVGVLRAQPGHFREQFADHRLQGGDIARQGGVGREAGGADNGGWPHRRRRRRGG
jgi:hypothetical protein